MMHIKVHIMTELLLKENFWHNDFFESLYLRQEVKQWNEAREIRTQVSHKSYTSRHRMRRTCSYFTKQRDNSCVNGRRNGRRDETVLPSPVEPVASLEQCVSCLCISCFETRLEWHEEIIQSFLQVALSWGHQDEGCCCNTVSRSVVVSRSVLFELELVCVRNFVYVHEVCQTLDDEPSSQCLLFMSIVVDNIQIQKKRTRRGKTQIRVEMSSDRVSFFFSTRKRTRGRKWQKTGRKRNRLRTKIREKTSSACLMKSF